MQKTILIWGAGRIGRGFVADLFAESGYRILFVDQAKALVEALRQRGEYTVVRTTGRARHDHVIDSFDALLIDQAQAVGQGLAEADVAAVAVFPKDFPTVAQQMAPGLLRRREERPNVPLDVILCTNSPHAGPAFREPLMAALPSEARPWAESHVGIVESLVIRMVADPPPEAKAKDPLLVWTNGYDRFPVNAQAFRGKIPPVSALVPVDNMRAQEMRKLYTYNTFHAALAYLGALRGHEFVVEALADPWVRHTAEAALDESSAALQAEYGFARDEMAEWTKGLVTQTDNPSLGDTVARFGADPRRKLRRDDRLIGPLLLCHKHGLETPGLLRAVAAGLIHWDTQETEQGPCPDSLIDTVKDLCGLSESESDLIEAIAEAHRRLSEETAWMEKAQKARQLGFEYEREYHGCGQSALAAVQDATQLLDQDAFNALFEAGTALAGGIGLCGDNTCSAFTAGALILGLYSPRRRAHFGGDREAKYRCYDLVQRLRERFLEHYGTVRCHDIHERELGRAFDLRDPAEREAFEAAGAHKEGCTNVVANAADWIVEIIGKEESGGPR